jgi:transposase
MGEVMTVGLDIAKHALQVHRVDETGAVRIRRKLRRSEVLQFFEGLSPCPVGVEACATAHHWARSIMALGTG